MIYKRWIWISGILFVLFLALGTPTTHPVQAAGPTAPHRGDPVPTYTLYLPILAAERTAFACRPISGATYTTLSVVGPGAPNPDAEHDAGYNINVLGYEPTDGTLGLVHYDGMIDSAPPPQLYHLFGDDRTPTFSTNYRLHNGDGSTIYDPAVTFSGMGVSELETIYAPDSGYDIENGYDAMVIYASERSITLNYTRNDNLQGYTVYVDGICVEPTLLALYRQLNTDGRHSLPVVRGNDPLGRALSTEIRVALRDTGSPMDPRSCKDWWQGRCP